MQVRRVKPTQALATIAEEDASLGQAPPVGAHWVHIGTINVSALPRQVVAKLFLSDFIKRYQVCPYCMQGCVLRWCAEVVLRWCAEVVLPVYVCAMQ